MLSKFTAAHDIQGKEILVVNCKYFINLLQNLIGKSQEKLWDKSYVFPIPIQISTHCSNFTGMVSGKSLFARRY